MNNDDGLPVSRKYKQSGAEWRLNIGTGTNFNCYHCGARFECWQEIPSQEANREADN